LLKAGKYFLKGLKGKY